MSALRWARTLAIALSMAVAAPAAAEPTNVAGAREAYAEGAAAYDAGDYARACPALARADALVANDGVLRFALTTCLRADDAAHSMNLVERARSRDVLGDLADKATTRFAGRLARVRLECGSIPCSASLDGVAIKPATGVWIPSGPHVLDIFTPARSERRALWLVDGAYQIVTPSSTSDRNESPPRPAPIAPSAETQATHPAVAPAPIERESGGVSPTWFWLGVGATAAAGGGAIASGVDALDKHSAFVANPSEPAASNGRDAQLRTNAFIAGTAALALTTAVVGLFAVRWSSPRSQRVARF